MNHSGGMNSMRSGSISSGSALGGNRSFSSGAARHTGGMNTAGTHHNSALHKSVVRNGSLGTGSRGTGSLGGADHHVGQQGSSLKGSNLNSALSNNAGRHAGGLNAATHNHSQTSLTSGRNHLASSSQNAANSSFMGRHSVNHSGNHAGGAAGNLANHNHNGANGHNGNGPNGNIGNHNHNHNGNGNNNGNWNHNHGNYSRGGFWPLWFGYNNFGYNNYNRYGRGGYPYWWYSYPYYGYPFYLGLFTPNYGFNFGTGLSNIAYNSYCAYPSYSQYPSTYVNDGPVIGDNLMASADGAQQNQPGEFVLVGETDFRQGNYQAAVRDWRHALLDDPQNGTLMLMLSQAMFATGDYDDAAGAAQQAMLVLPEDQWGVVVSNYRELYPKTAAYTEQLRALEKVMKEKPEEAALHFLAGYHYAFLGYPADAVKQLEKTRALAPQDELAKKLLDVMTARAAGVSSGTKVPLPPPAPATTGTATPTTNSQVAAEQPADAIE